MADRRPHLIHGGDLVDFLKGRRAAKRQKCGPAQFFCVKCRQPRDPAEGMVEYQPSSASRGVLVAICPVCEMLMRRFVSGARPTTTAPESDLKVAPAQQSLVDTPIPAVDCHLRAEN
jgi:hypothetical protein